VNVVTQIKSYVTPEWFYAPIFTPTKKSDYCPGSDH